VVLEASFPEQHDPSLQAPKHGSRRFAYLGRRSCQHGSAPSNPLRRAATVYSACTIPNTVALTFVSWHLGSCLGLTNVNFDDQDDGPYLTRKSLPDPHIFVDWPPMVDSTDVVDKLDSAGAKGTFFFSEWCTKWPCGELTWQSSLDGNNCTNLCYPDFLIFSCFHRGCIYNQAAVDRVNYAYSRGHMIGSHTWAHRDLATLTRTESAYSIFLLSPTVFNTIPSCRRDVPFGAWVFENFF